MTIDEANTALAIASTKQQRLAAYNALALAARQAADELNAPKECPSCGDPHWRTFGCVCANNKTQGFKIIRTDEGNYQLLLDNKSQGLIYTIKTEHVSFTFDEARRKNNIDAL